MLGLPVCLSVLIVVTYLHFLVTIHVVYLLGYLSLFERETHEWLSCLWKSENFMKAYKFSAGIRTPYTLIGITMFLWECLYRLGI